jgi:hypothetical protein
VTGGVSGTGESGIDFEEAIHIKEESIKVEETVDVKCEMPEAIVFPPIKTEPEVRFWGLCVWWGQLLLVGHVLPQKGNCEITHNCIHLYVTLCV